MSWGTCYAGSNNIHANFPPIMMDGRNFANWQPGASINEQIRKDAGIKSNWEYRKYLSTNADKIIHFNQLTAFGECGGNTPHGASLPVSNNSPYLYKSCQDKTMNYGYDDSDLKNLYISSVDIDARMVTPVVTQAQLLENKMQRIN
jgi:hypothetical protein